MLRYVNTVVIEVAHLDDTGAPALRPAIGEPVRSRSRDGLTTGR
ncbi:unannotated protein [freshwater metagenome]|uniref:Unannotated protein n=1 Tax=freshwater metagenome TaxID=449393 RepID=A0A6J6BWB4_9ZZZZ